MFAAEGERAVRAHNERMSLAWHVAALMRQKKLPALDKMMAKSRHRRHQAPQPWGQQLAIAKLWAAAGGGTISKKAN